MSWPFLWRALDKYGFGNNFKRWVCILCEEAGARIIVNGSLTEHADIEQSVRQGFALAPLLFIIVGETFTWRIMVSRRIRGITDPAGQEHRLSAVADDNMLFTLLIEASMKAIVTEINLYCFLSGLVVNWEKSEIVVVNFTGELPLCIRHIRRVPDGGKIKHLGLPCKAEEDNDEVGREVIRKLTDRASNLQLMKLSLAGRVVALNAILVNNLWYYLFVWAPSKQDEKRLKEIILNFLWNKPLEEPAPMSWVMWRHITQPVLRGGLGLTDPFLKTKALHAQWVLKALSPGKFPWSGFIQQKMKLVSHSRTGTPNVAHLLAEKPFT